MADPITIGTLRWPVTIATRVMSAAASGGTQETIMPVLNVRADVQPAGPLTFYAGVQVDTPVTHKIIIRWLDWLDTTHIIQRETRRLDGSIRTETFRIRRVMEVAGRKRFLLLECEEEKRQ